MPSDKPTSKLSEHRRSNKPIMEKKRRARINNCLNELKNLLLEAMRKDPARHSKLEKADILEMTVKHLQHLQRQQMALAVAADPGVVTKYRAGFNECAEEVSRYMGTLDGIESPVKQRLLNHLANCINGLQGVVAVGALSRSVVAGSLVGGAGGVGISPVQLIPSRLPGGEMALLVQNRAVAGWQFANQPSVYGRNGAAVPAGRAFQPEGVTPLEVTPQTFLTVDVDCLRHQSSPILADESFSPSPCRSPDSCGSNSPSSSTSDCSDHLRFRHSDVSQSCDACIPECTGWNSRCQRPQAAGHVRNHLMLASDGGRDVELGSHRRFEKQQDVMVRCDRAEPEALIPVDLSKDADRMWRPW